MVDNSSHFATGWINEGLAAGIIAQAVVDKRTNSKLVVDLEENISDWSFAGSWVNPFPN
ncbi:MAG: hypothetical protein QNK37_15915 [Acidobacteriota bacterium]|nr:hypothetical protein [Acidobacteriota bacterium]